MDVLKSHACTAASHQARKQSIEQQKLVLRYPDLAARLCTPPLRWTHPHHWNGYVPPAYDAEDVDGVTRLNTSPVRAALMALLEEAAERADGEMPAGRAA